MNFKSISGAALLVVFLLEAGGLAAAPEPLVIDPAQSRVEIDVKATVDAFTAKLETYQAAITVDGGHVTTAVFRFNFGSIRTGKEGRDEAMNDWQETSRHPDGAFTLTALEAAGGARFNARGTLVLHGVSREIVFPVSVITDRRIYAMDGEATLDTREFGLRVIRKFGLLKVEPLVKVRFHLQGAVAGR